MRKIKASGSKVVLRWQRLGLWRGFMGGGEHASRQRRMALAADKIVRRWINLALSPAMSRWMGYVEEKKGMMRAASKVVHRMQRMQLWAAFAKLDDVTMGARDSEERMVTCAEQWSSVEAFHAGVTRRLTDRAFVVWHLECGEEARSKRREYVASKAVRRWQHQTLGHAWECWYEQHVKLVRLKQLSTRILLRWTHGTTSGAWTTWYEEYATAKRHALQAHKLACWCLNAKYARAFARWEVQTAE